MTLYEHLSNLRVSLNDVHSDNKYSLDHIRVKFIEGMSAVLRSELKANSIPSWMIHSFFMKTIDASELELPCIQLGCKLKRSKYKLPQALPGTHGEIYSIHKDEYLLKPSKTLSNFNNDLSDLPHLYLYNGYVYFKDWKPKAFLISGVWQNILDWEDIQYCNGDECPSIFRTLDLGIPAVLTHKINSLVIQLLMNKREDITQNENVLT